MKDRTRGFLLVVLAALCLSTIPTVIKLGLRDGADPLQLLAPRMILGAVLLWLWVALTRPHRLRIDRRGLLTCALAGAINTVSLSLFYLGLRRLDASVVIVIFSIFPAILLLMLHLRGESVTRRDMIRLTLAVAGVALVANVGGGVDLLGVAAHSRLRDGLRRVRGLSCTPAWCLTPPRRRRYGSSPHSLSSCSSHSLWRHLPNH